MFEQTNETGPSQESMDILQPLIITSQVFSFVSFDYKKLSGSGSSKLQKNYWFNDWHTLVKS